MPDTNYLFPLSFLAIGAVIVIIGVIIGAWIMFKGKSQPGTGESFLKDPKGEVFTIPDDLGEATLPRDEKPTLDEENVLKKTERVLNLLGRGSENSM